MKGLFTASLGLLLLPFSLLANSVELTSGMVIKTSVTIQPRTYTLAAFADLKKPSLVIEGNNITVDFNKAVLQGSADKSRPDEFYGLAILVKKGSKNITIKNAFIHGYKVAILADSVENLTIDHCDLSYNWRQHLQSNREREDISDWMSYHHNEKEEWLRYGAAIYLVNCRSAVISNNLVTGGQCALMMTRCEKASVWDNDFSFNSGIGIGLYRSSHNQFYHNRLDYNVRGYSHGKYKRGQDSAGFLVFEQSSNNVFAFNTATHSGDGFFLWAGQTTMDTGEGGSNDNFVYGNDFSYAPTNGVEITFSRNLVMKNLIKDCDHGIWGGYSYDTDITDNTFENNRIGIAIEHGQNINLVLNSFTNDQTGVKLWSREKQPADWIYAQKKNTDSRNYWIAANKFTATPKAFDIMGTDTVVFSGNTKLLVQEPLVLGERAENIDTSREAEVLDMEYQKDERLKSINATALPATVLPQGKKEMRITEWGPYDFRYPLLWLTDIDSSGQYHFEVLGPKGNWELTATDGFTIIDKGSNGFPSTITATAQKTQAQRAIRLQYKGPGYRDQFGKWQDSSTTHSFAYSEFEPPAQWTINWYTWNAGQDPGKDYTAFTAALEQTPVHSTVTPKVDFTWWGKIGKDLPADSFATVATTTMILPANTYEVGITADDYVKLFIDDQELINAWDSQYTELDENTHHRTRIKLSAGEHRFRIVHAEKKGLATLQFYFKPVEKITP
ncbi:MAG TPA: right-handed parallel beta-helix repeat-containing protein [Sediminibacterium sp.]